MNNYYVSANSNITKAVIPAAGHGTRLLPATKAQPKEMLPVVDKPAIQYVVEEAFQSGLNDILMITGRGKMAIENHFDKSYELEDYLEKKEDYENLNIVRDISTGPDIFFVRQKEPKGLGHAVLCAEQHIGNEPFLVLLGDDLFVSDQPFIPKLTEFYNDNPGVIVVIQEVPRDKTSLYGIVDIEDSDDDFVIVNDMVEKPSAEDAPSNWAIIGRYLLPPEIFGSIRQTRPDKRGEIQLTDAMKNLMGKVPIYGFKFRGRRYDIGNKFSYLAANIELALMRDDLKDPLQDYLTMLTYSSSEKQLISK